MRHIKKCERPPGPSLRQKACNKCAASKTRCDLRKPCCTRCLKRGFSCEYVSPSQEAADTPTSHRPSEQFESSGNPSGSVTNDVPKPPQPQTSLANLQDETMSSYSGYPSLDDFLYPPPNPLNTDGCTSGSTLPDISPGNAGVIPTPECSGPGTPDEPLLEQLDGFDAMHGQISLHMHTGATPENALINHSMEFLFRTFRSWPRMMAQGFQLPPLFHHSQTPQQNVPLPLANCFTLTKMWHGQCEGTSELIRETIQNEMKGLCAKVSCHSSPFSYPAPSGVVTSRPSQSSRSNLTTNPDFSYLVSKPRRSDPPRSPPGISHIHNHHPLPIKIPRNSIAEKLPFILQIGQIHPRCHGNGPGSPRREEPYPAPLVEGLGSRNLQTPCYSNSLSSILVLCRI